MIYPKRQLEMRNNILFFFISKICCNFAFQMQDNLMDKKFKLYESQGLQLLFNKR